RRSGDEPRPAVGPRRHQRRAAEPLTRHRPQDCRAVPDGYGPSPPTGGDGPPEVVMKAAVWHGRRDVRVETVPDPTIGDPTDAIIRVTSSGLCGSDLHLYEVLAPFMTPGDILGHEPMGVVEAVGPGVPNLRVGDRVVVPFNIAC